MVDTPALAPNALDLGAAGPDGEPVPGSDALPEGEGWRSAADVGPDAARSAWAEVAREQLIITARRYGSVTTYKELGEVVQERSGIRTKQRLHVWLSDVLRQVARDCAARDEPNLGSLCVNAAGSVGEGYRLAVAETTGQAPPDPDRDAAHVRLECHRHFGAVDLPAGGGSAALTPRLAATRTRTRKAAHEARPVPTCPTCHLALTASGVCDNCD
jgi:hypothetical protein